MTPLPRDFEGLLNHLNEETLDPDVEARDLYDTVASRMPYGLWLHNEIKKPYEEGEDWQTQFTPVGTTIIVTRQVALWVAQRQRTPIGNLLLKTMAARFSEAMKIMRSQPGNEDLNTVEGLFARVNAHAERRQRFKGLMA